MDVPGAAQCAGAFVPGVEGVIEAKEASGSIIIKMRSGRYAFELTGE
jgi:hypothetical protein